MRSFPDKLKFYVDKYYKDHEVLGSLMSARVHFDDELITTYSDIVFDEKIAQSIIQFSGEIGIAVDLNWESNYEGEPDPQDNEVKFGVQITPLDEICDKYKGKNSSISVRQINCPEKLLSSEILKEVHSVVYDKKYDFYLKDLIDAIQRKDRDPQKKDRFWCSALLGYIYTNCGMLNKETDWSILRPSDFTSEGQIELNFNEGISLGPMIQFSP